MYKKVIYTGTEDRSTLTIRGGITKIHPYEYSNHVYIKQLSIPDSVVKIGFNAFANTPWFEAQPEGLVYAGKVAYQYKGEMPKDSHITLPVGTRGVAGGAFHSYTSMKGISIPDGCIAIGNIAFYGCENLIHIDIPDSVRHIEPLAFDYTAWYDAQPDGVVYAGKVAYSFKGQLPRTGHIEIRDGTMSITKEAFAHIEEPHEIKSITIPESVTIIGEDLFVNCTENFSKKVTIRCKKDSRAYYYAKEIGAKIELI